MSTSPERLHSVDAIRAVALLGIFLVHTHGRFNYFPPLAGESWLNTCFDWLIMNLMLSKAFMLFSFLFGLSFYLQLSRAAAKGVDFRWRFCWRLILLIGFGVFHRIFYNGDILIIFGILGFLLVLIWKWPTRLLAILAIFFALQPLILYLEWLGQPGAMYEWYAHVAQSLQLPPMPHATSATWYEMMQWNLIDGFLHCPLYMIWSHRLSCVLAMFMFGIIAGRRQFIEGSSSRLIKFAFLGAVLYALFTAAIHAEFLPQLKTSFEWWSGISFVLMVISAFALLFRQGFMQGIIRPFCALGRCTLTAYIMQSIFMAFLCCGWGLGLGESLSTAQIISTALAFYALQLLAATIWLRYFKFGPLEHLWRKLTRIGIKTNT